MAILRPFRDYDEKDVINLFSYNATAANLTGSSNWKKPGELVDITTGWSTDVDMWDNSGTIGNIYNNTVSPRFNNLAKVGAVTDAGDWALGMLLHGVQEDDENGELLKYNPNKAAELQVVTWGQTVPVVRKGIFLIETAATLGANQHAALYVADDNGEIGIVADDDTSGASGHILGFTLGKSVSRTKTADSGSTSTVYDTLIVLNCDRMKA
jgi:hypothetical protein